MANENEMKVIFGADTTDLTSKVDKATNDVDEFGKKVTQAAGQASKGFDNLARSVAKVNLNKATSSTDALVKATAKLDTTSNSAAFALQNVGRVAQDLPFGFIGIQNNLNPLLESFQRLKAETGSTKGALKALASSIGGVGGLGLALSLASSAFLIFQNGIGGFGKRTKDAQDDFEKFLSTIRSTSDITQEAAGSVEAEIVKVRTLADTIRDVNASQRDRKTALEQLKQINKSYFGDLTLEASSLQSLTGITNEYTAALIQQAKAKGFADEISKIAPELNKQEGILTRLQSEYNAIGRVTKEDQAAATRWGASLQDVQKVMAKGAAEQAFLNQRNLVEKLRNQVVGLEGDYTETLQAGLKFKSLEPPKTPKADADRLKEQIALLEKLRSEFGLLKSEEFKLGELRIELLLRDGAKSGLSTSQIERVRQEIIDQVAQKEKAPIKFPISIIPSVSVSPANDIAAGGLSDSFNDKMIASLAAAGKAAGDAYRQAMQDAIATKISDAVAGSIENAFSGIGEAIGNAFNGDGGLAGAAQSFLNVIGTVLQQVGIQIIATSQAMIALKAALKTLFANPLGGLAAGIGLIAVGQVLKNIKLNVPKFAEGGLVTGPTLGLIGEAGPELIVPLNRANQFMDNSGPIEVFGEFKLIGKDLVAAVERAITTGTRKGK